MNTGDEDRSGPDAGSGRRRIAVGVAAVALVLGGGAYLVTSRVSAQQHSAVTGDAGALAPFVPPGSQSPGLPPSEASRAKPAGTPAATRTSKPAPTAKPASAAEIRKQITAAREKAARDGFPLQRPLPSSTVAIHDASSYVEESRHLSGGGTMRVMSARYDLSGQREMQWAADDGRPVGDARCTQKFHFSVGGPAAVRPTMLLCWRTSSNRSVVVLTVVKNPSPAQSVDVIDKQWRHLG